MISSNHVVINGSRCQKIDLVAAGEVDACSQIDGIFGGNGRTQR
jgi:hypothetical protein